MPRRSKSARQRAAKVEKLIARDGPDCHYCRTYVSLELLTLDHVVPESQDGPWYVENLLISCYPCNHARGDADYEPYAVSKGVPRGHIVAVLERSAEAMKVRAVIPRPDIAKPKKIRPSYNQPVTTESALRYAGEAMHEIQVLRDDKRSDFDRMTKWGRYSSNPWREKARTPKHPGSRSSPTCREGPA